MPKLDVPDGYYDLPPGKLANVATFLEMREKPERALGSLPAHASLYRFGAGDAERYRVLFREVGGNLMWFSRLYFPDEKLDALFSDPAVESFALKEGDQSLGLLELDFRTTGECELAFYGLVPAAQGKGLGRALMDEVLRRAWSRPISRLWVHTCSFDGPLALPLYLKSGFKPYARKVEIHDDPRVTGKLLRTASPQIPIIE